MSTFLGPCSLFHLRDLLISEGAKKVFLVTGENLFEVTGGKKYISTLSSDFIFEKFSDFSENPKVEDVQRGIKLFLNFDADIIVAFGGGSHIDMAKLINALSGKIDIENQIKTNRINHQLLPLIAIPTTAGSGSEATQFAVIYLGPDKYSISDQRIKPIHSILDFNLLKSQSSYQMAVSGIDAFSQAIESCWSINSTEESLGYSKKAIKLIWENLPNAINSRLDKSLNKVMEGAHLAGEAINISKTTAPHALSYGFTSFCNLPHGHAVALSLPYFINLHQTISDDSCIDKRGSEWIFSIMNSICEVIDVQFSSLPKSVADFIQYCGIDIKFANLNIDQKCFDIATSKINLERLNNNPFKINESIIKGLFSCEFNNS